MAYLFSMLPDLPLYALQRIADDRWVVWTPDADPRLPAICTVAVIDAKSNFGGPVPEKSYRQRALPTRRRRYLLRTSPPRIFHAADPSSRF
jgi:hypothetical protein